MHLDGARLANAAAALDLPLRALTTDAGVDILSFGATKNGALAAEAVVVLDPALATEMLFLRKQTLQLASKMRFIAAQLGALLTGELWRENAVHANAMAARLAAALEGAPGLEHHPPGAGQRRVLPAAGRAPGRRCTSAMTSTTGTRRRARYGGCVPGTPPRRTSTSSPPRSGPR